ncbi:uncharacterized protein EV154DRAFT_488545 [Mucor mucedo]|uniref:uncharacterized protein n=1 Tax=Mucor mucedo TaxID=29922 RepID=UPI0022200EC9|nr:uncharacterized protein EV154DRAFT_488545 [Mucor mucedo]KAI7866481.1 hypothetical protein EV154DRAFT_488545 [Mucor mucedo]
MSSLKQYPFEVLFAIASNLEKKDQLTFLTVCKAWYRPLLESIYNQVEIDNLKTFRSFLVSITHHRHLPNLYVRKLKLPSTTGIYEWDQNERSMTFTEFELLARHCTNLTEISFFGNGYWAWMNKLDLSKLWLRLTKLPLSFGVQDSYHVFQSMATRLVSFELGMNFPGPFYVMNLLPLMNNLQTIYIHDRKLSMDLSCLKNIKYLRNLTLLTNVSPNKYDIHPVQPNLKTLTCAIDDPNSNWFPILKALYKNIICVSIYLIVDKHNTGDKLLRMIGAVLDMIHDTNIQQVKTFFPNIDDFALAVESAIMDTVYDYTIWDKSGTLSTINLDIRYFDHSGFVFSHNSFESVFSRQNVQEHVFKLATSRPDDSNCNYEVDFLVDIIKPPINLQLKKLSVTIATSLYHTRLPEIKDTRLFYLDTTLDHFPYLDSFTLIVDVKEVNPNSKSKIWTDRVNCTELTISNFRLRKPHSFIHFLTIQSAKINRSVYHYLFKFCRYLWKLHLVDCHFSDDETVIALEYLCLQNHVELRNYWWNKKAIRSQCFNIRFCFEVFGLILLRLLISSIPRGVGIEESQTEEVYYSRTVQLLEGSAFNDFSDVGDEMAMSIRYQTYQGVAAAIMRYRGTC